MVIKRVIHQIIIKRCVQLLQVWCPVIHNRPWQQRIDIQNRRIAVTDIRGKLRVHILLQVQHTQSCRVPERLKRFRHLIHKKICGIIADFPACKQ